jgi:TPR repeat protein
MRMCNFRTIAALASGLILVSFAVGADEAPRFASATEAYHQGMADFKSGRTDEALPALEYAAERGVLGAQLKLARVYASGNGLKQNDIQAFYFYRQIANQRADITPQSPVAKFIAEAFVALGQYYLQGIPGTAVAQDPALAADLFRHAASYFGDADAQYALARLYLSGTGVDRNAGLAVNWLATAAKKQHAAAQAKLGELLWRGGADIRQRPARGLALIMLGHANAQADGKEPKWIEELYLEAKGTSDAATLKEAEALMPELGGPHMDLTRDMAKATAPDKLIVPASGGSSSNPAPGAAVPGDAVASGGGALASGEGAGSVHAPSELGMPVGFGPASSDPAPKP